MKYLLLLLAIAALTGCAVTYSDPYPNRTYPTYPSDTVIVR